MEEAQVQVELLDFKVGIIEVEIQAPPEVVDQVRQEVQETIWEALGQLEHLKSQSPEAQVKVWFHQ